MSSGGSSSNPFTDRQFSKENQRLYTEQPTSELTRNVNPSAQRQILLAKKSQTHSTASIFPLNNYGDNSNPPNSHRRCSSIERQTFTKYIILDDKGGGHRPTPITTQTSEGDSLQLPIIGASLNCLIDSEQRARKQEQMKHGKQKKIPVFNQTSSSNTEFELTSLRSKYVEGGEEAAAYLSASPSKTFDFLRLKNEAMLMRAIAARTRSRDFTKTTSTTSPNKVSPFNRTTVDLKHKTEAAAATTTSPFRRSEGSVFLHRNRDEGEQPSSIQQLGIFNQKRMPSKHLDQKARLEKALKLVGNFGASSTTIASVQLPLPPPPDPIIIRREKAATVTRSSRKYSIGSTEQTTTLRTHEELLPSATTSAATTTRRRKRLKNDSVQSLLAGEFSDIIAALTKQKEPQHRVLCVDDYSPPPYPPAEQTTTAVESSPKRLYPRGPYTQTAGFRKPAKFSSNHSIPSSPDTSTDKIRFTDSHNQSQTHLPLEFPGFHRYMQQQEANEASLYTPGQTISLLNYYSGLGQNKLELSSTTHQLDRSDISSISAVTSLSTFRQNLRLHTKGLSGSSSEHNFNSSPVMRNHLFHDVEEQELEEEEDEENSPIRYIHNTIKTLSNDPNAGSPEGDKKARTRLLLRNIGTRKIISQLYKIQDDELVEEKLPPQLEQIAVNVVEEEEEVSSHSQTIVRNDSRLSALSAATVHRKSSMLQQLSDESALKSAIPSIKQIDKCPSSLQLPSAASPNLLSAAFSFSPQDISAAGDEQEVTKDILSLSQSQLPQTREGSNRQANSNSHDTSANATQQEEEKEDEEDEEEGEENADEVGDGEFVMKKDIDFNQLRNIRDKMNNKGTGTAPKQQAAMLKPTGPVRSSFSTTSAIAGVQQNSMRKASLFKQPLGGKRSSVAGIAAAASLVSKFKDKRKVAASEQPLQEVAPLPEEQPPLEPLINATVLEEIRLDQLKESDKLIAAKLESQREKIRFGLRIVVKDFMKRKSDTIPIWQQSLAQQQEILDETNREVSQTLSVIFGFYNCVVDNFNYKDRAPPTGEGGDGSNNNAKQFPSRADCRVMQAFSGAEQDQFARVFEDELCRTNILSSEEFDRFKWIYDTTIKMKVTYSDIITDLGGLPFIRETIASLVKRMSSHVSLFPINFTFKFDAMERKILPGVCALLCGDSKIVMRTIRKFLVQDKEEFSYIDFFFLKKEIDGLLSNKVAAGMISQSLAFAVLQKIESTRRYIFPNFTLDDTELREEVARKLSINTSFMEMFKAQGFGVTQILEITNKIFDYLYSDAGVTHAVGMNENLTVVEETTILKRDKEVTNWKAIKVLIDKYLKQRMSRKVIDYFEVVTQSALQQDRFTRNVIVRDLHYKFTKLRLKLGFRQGIFGLFTTEQAQELIVLVRQEAEEKIASNTAQSSVLKDSEKAMDFSFLTTYLRFLLSEYDIFSVYDFSVAIPYFAVSNAVFKFQASCLKSVLLNHFNLLPSKTSILLRYVEACCPAA